MQDQETSMPLQEEWMLQVKELHLHLETKAVLPSQATKENVKETAGDYSCSYHSVAAYVKRFHRTFAGKVFRWLNRIRLTPGQQKTLTLLNASALFDAAWYMTRYPDVQLLGHVALEHFIVYGWREGRNPGPQFDTAFYLKTYLDVQQAGVNPLEHFIKFGRAEDRVPQPGGNNV